MRFLIVGLAVFAVTTTAQAGPKSSSPTSHSVGSRTVAPTSKISKIKTAKPSLTEATQEYIIGTASNLNSVDTHQQNQLKQDQLQQLKTKKQNSRIPST